MTPYNIDFDEYLIELDQIARDANYTLDVTNSGYLMIKPPKVGYPMPLITADAIISSEEDIFWFEHVSVKINYEIKESDLPSNMSFEYMSDKWKSAMKLADYLCEHSWYI